MVQSQIYHQYGSLVNKKIFLICHGHGEQSFLESILNKYLQPEHYIPIKTLSPNKSVHKSSVQMNNLTDVFTKSLVSYRNEISECEQVYFIFMLDTQERDQNKVIEANYITGKLTNDLSAICTEITGHVPKICCLYSVKGIENAISEVYPELQPKNGITHLRLAKPYLSVELFSSYPLLANSNLNCLKSFIDKNILEL